MGIGACLKKGFGVARQVRSAAWILLLVNLGIAALAAFPIYRGMLRFTGMRVFSCELEGAFPIEWLPDFYLNSPGSIDRYAFFIVIFGLLSIPVNSILAGGVLAQFRRAEEDFRLGNFCHDTWCNAWRLIRLMIVALILYWIIFRVLHQGLGGLIARWTEELSSDRAAFWLQFMVSLLVLVGLLAVNLAVDFARIKLVMDENTSALGSFVGACGFCLRRLAGSLVVYAVPSLCGLALLALYRWAVPWNELGAPWTIALLFIGQQVIMFGRYWFRVATWASEWSYYVGSRRTETA